MDNRNRSSVLDYKRVLAMLERGQITTAEAFVLFRELEEEQVLLRLEKNEEKLMSLDEITRELDSLIGLDKAKKLVKEIKAFVEIQKKREEEKLNTEPIVLHMIFRGNPGTGKTTVARILGKIFKEMGILEKGHLIEVERADLVGEFIGHTAQKTRDQIRKALGGILFIDEAYSLARGGEKDFGKEAIDTLVKAMEDYKDNLILILAGYQKEMEEFLNTNPGLRSRFPIQIDFEDYSIDELIKISKLMLEKREYKLSKGAEKKLRKILEQKRFKNQDKVGNARLVRNLIEKAIRMQAVRLVNKKNVSRQDLIYIQDGDLVGVDEI